MIISLSDVHLGIEESNRKEFLEFLDFTKEELRPDDFVLNGDIEDLWRRGLRTCTRENYDVFSKFEQLQGEGIRLHYVLGNHDWYARHDSEYGRKDFFDTNYTDRLRLEESGKTYEFQHGHQFDPTQDKFYFDFLAYVSNDPVGEGFDEAWRAFKRTEKYAEEIENYLERFVDWIKGEKGRKKRKFKERLSEMDKAAKVLENWDSQIRRALEYVEGKKEIDVEGVGHTHQYFLSEGENLVNSGSWVNDSPPNTLMLTEKGNPHVVKYENDEIYEISGEAKIILE